MKIQCTAMWGSGRARKAPRHLGDPAPGRPGTTGGPVGQPPANRGVDWNSLAMKPFLARLAARELPWVAALAFLATYGFFCEYLPPMERVHIYSDI